MKSVEQEKYQAGGAAVGIYSITLTCTCKYNLSAFGQQLVSIGLSSRRWLVCHSLRGQKGDAIPDVLV